MPYALTSYYVYGIMTQTFQFLQQSCNHIAKLYEYSVLGGWGREYSGAGIWHGIVEGKQSIWRTGLWVIQEDF